LSNPVASPDATALAALRPTANELVIADLHLGAQPTAMLRRVIALPASSSGLEVQPEWLDANRILVAVRGVDPLDPQLALIDATTGAMTLVAAPGLAALGPLSAISVSRDGTRLIAISGVAGVRQAYLGRILTPIGTPIRTAGTVVTGWSKIPTDMADVAGVSWSGDLELAVLGRPTTAPAASATLHAELVELDGVTDPTPLPALPSDFEALVAAPERPVITTSPGRPAMLDVGTKRWVLDAGQWEVASPARDPLYP
jgi:Lipoprotein LpqB beta-propeller domain